MSSIRIQDLQEVTPIDAMKLPTGGFGDVSVTIEGIFEHFKLKNVFATKEALDNHINNKNNPHQVTKEQVGLDRVNNTNDLEKPISNATQIALDKKADTVNTYTKEQTNNLLAQKANFTDVYQKTDTYSKAEVDTKVGVVSGGYFKAFETLAELQAATGMTTGQVAKVMNDPTSANNGDYYYNGTSWVKGYDSLTDAKAYADANPLFKIVEITSSANFDNFQTAGQYTFTTNAFTASTSKPQTDVGGVLVVYGKGVSYLLSQEYRSYKNEIFFRFYTTSWSPWITYNTIELTSAIDFNLYKDRNQFVINGTNTTASTNKPPVTVGGVFQILGKGSNYLTSQVFTTWTNEIYTRSLTDVWSSWKKLAFNSDFDVVAITAGIDFDTYKTQKTYSVTNIAIQASTHAPDSTFGGILRVIGTGANYLTHQIYIDYKGSYFYRSLEINWTAWKKMATTDVTDSLALQIANIQTPNTGLTGKKWLAVGDSITVGLNATKSYADVLAERYTATLTKHATSGAWISAGTGTIAIPNILSQTYTSLPDSANFDFITIAAGTNDRINGTDGNLGVFDDRTTSTFYGALHTLIAGLKTKYPNARMLFISQTPRSGLRTNPITPTDLDKKYKAIIDVCDYYSVPVWAGHKNFGFHPDDNASFKSTYMPDGLHPSDAGHLWYANRLEQVIISNAK